MSCIKEQKTQEETPKQTFKSTVTAEKLLSLSIEASGLDKLYNATLTFEKNDIKFESKREGLNYQFRMIYENEGVVHEATASNGNFNYKENEATGVVQRSSFLEQNLVSDNQIIAIPRLYKYDNNVLLKQLNQTQINGISYRAIQVSYKNPFPTDMLRDTRIYINPKTLLVDFICYRYGNNESRLIWLERTKRHNLEGIIISDYKVYFSPNNKISHEDMVLLYSTNGLKTKKTVKHKNLKLTQH